MNKIRGSTAEGYGRKYRIFAEDFCQPRGLVAFPASLSTVIAYRHMIFSIGIYL
jgi:hypothetical protein